MFKKLIAFSIPIFFLGAFIFFPKIEINVWGKIVYLNTFFTISLKVIAAIYLFGRWVKQGSSVLTVALFFATISTIVADLAYVWGYFMPVSKKPLLTLIDESFYCFYTSLIIVTLFKIFSKNIKETFLITGLGIFALLFGYNISEFSYHDLFLGNIITGIACIANHCSIAFLFGSIIMFSFRAENMKRLIILQGLLLLVIAHFGLNARLVKSVEIVFFEGVWEMGAICLSVMTLLFLDDLENGGSSISLMSLRTLIVFLSILGGGTVLTGLVIMDIAVIPDDVTVSYTALSMYVVWFFSNIFGFSLSGYIRNKTMPENGNLMGMTKIAEIDGVSSRYNILHKKYTDEHQYNVFGRAAMCIVEMHHRGMSTMESYLKTLSGIFSIPKAQLKHVGIMLKSYNLLSIPKAQLKHIGVMLKAYANTSNRSN